MNIEVSGTAVRLSAGCRRPKDATTSHRPMVTGSSGRARAPGLLRRARLGCLRLGARRVAVVVVPPLVCRGLGVALWRVLPLLLPTERSDVEITPGASHRLVATAADEVGAIRALVVEDEGVCAV